MPVLPGLVTTGIICAEGSMSLAELFGRGVDVRPVSFAG
jgi:hypothetical protein